MKKTSNRLHSLFATLAALILAAALAVPAFAVEGGFADLYYRVFDDAEVLTEDEDNELEDALEELSLRQSFDVTIATIESMESVGADSMEQFADDLYDYCQYGYGPDMDGVLLLVSVGDRKWHISTCGYGITAFTDAGIQYLGEQMTPFMADGDYAGAFRTFVQWSDTYIDAARAGHPYDVNNLPREPLSPMYLVLALGITYPLLEGVASWLIVRSRLPGFTLRHGIDNAWMGTFGNVICLGAGAVPMQTYYLHRCGLGLGPGVGLMTLQYVFHKASVLVYATVLLLWNRQWFTAHATGVLSYLPAAYTVVAGVILGLVLLCTAPLVQSLARRALGLLPKTEKWQARRESWQTQLDTLSEESRHLLTEKSRCLKIFAVHLCKLFLMYTCTKMQAAAKNHVGRPNMPEHSL